MDDAKVKKFYEMVRPIFPDLEIVSRFDETAHHHIFTNIKTGGYSSPLEMAGTGVLQAVQVAAYATLYEPTLLLLDEPDAHLHPGNQKQLVNLIFEVSRQTNTQIVMASHSRHVLDKVLKSPLGEVRWLKHGEIQDFDGADLSLLMDIGALDEFEELSKSRVKKLIFCEDNNTRKLESFLISSGVEMDEVHVVPFDGIDNLSAAKTVVKFFLSLGPDRKAVIYRDGDCMTDEEKTWLKGKAAQALPENASLYISKYTDIEHSFCDYRHIAKVADIEEAEALEIVNACLEKNQARLAVKGTHKRADLKNKSQKGNQDFSSTEKIFGSGVPFEMALGSILLPSVLDELKVRGHPVGRLDVPSEYVADFDILVCFE